MPPKDSPYIDPTGTIIIPFAADPKYHYWNGGQPLSETQRELKPLTPLVHRLEQIIQSQL